MRQIVDPAAERELWIVRAPALGLGEWVTWLDRSAPVEEQVRGLAADARGRRGRLTAARRSFGG